MDTLIESIYGIWKFDRPAGLMTRARSTPGHLIHYIASGSYHLTTDNRDYDVQAGDLVYYFESEDVVWRGKNSPVMFYSIGFSAPNLTPPSLSNRLLRSRQDLEVLFADALVRYNDGANIEQRLQLTARVSDIVAEFFTDVCQPESSDLSLWWQIESQVKRQRLFKADLPTLCRLSGYSRATIIRACKHSTGSTPIARLRELRMEEAKGLLEYSIGSISDIALYLGYTRIHEFSREFSKMVGRAPTAFRKERGHPR